MTVTLDCDNGHVYEVAVSGNGEFTPARVLASNQVLVPVSFGTFHVHAVLPDGSVFDESEPGTSKGGGNVAAHNPQTTTTCTFEVTETLAEADPESGLPAGTVFTFTGDVTAFIAGQG